MMKSFLSLFEPDIHVIVRGKAGEDVEFGNLLVLGEQSDGLISDWELFEEEVPADVQLVRPSVERVERGLKAALKSLVTERGFDNKTNLKWLEQRGIFAGLCPRDPGALRQAMKDEDFAQAQRRRAQTEARVAIFKNEFLGRPNEKISSAYCRTVCPVSVRINLRVVRVHRGAPRDSSSCLSCALILGCDTCSTSLACRRLPSLATAQK